MTGGALSTGSPPPIGELPVTFTPRLVVLDVDGTLVGPGLQVHPRARAAVRAAASRLPVILATGRMYRSALPWAEDLEVVQPLVCYQGALVRELPRPEGPGAVLFEEGLDAEVAVDAVRLARQRGWHIQGYQDDELICDQDRPETHLYARVAQVPIHFVDDLAKVVSNGSIKLVCVSDDPAVIEDIVSGLGAALGGRARITRSLDQFVEIVSPAVNKARAIDVVCARLGFTVADGLAVGDGSNDMEMLAEAGCGVAVRSARPEVLAVADATCRGPDEAGVADVLEHFGLA